MTVRVNKSSFNIREKLSELERPIGLKGSELMRAETAQEARDFVSAGRKNLVINGAMQIWQRGTSKTSFATFDYYTADRWVAGTNSGSIDMEQSTDTPPGFGYSLKISVNTTGSSTGNQTHLDYYIEAQDLQHLKWGTGEAEPITVSFWMKSTSTQTKYLWLYAPDAGDHIARPFSVKQANVWERISITVPGNTRGVIANDTGRGLYVRFTFDAGSTYTGGTPTTWTTISNSRFVGIGNFMSDANNELYLTGVQLEVGKNATEFEHRSYGEELQLCKRYYERGYHNPITFGDPYGNATWQGFFEVEKRSTGTLSYDDGQGNTSRIARWLTSGYSTNVQPAQLQTDTVKSFFGYLTGLSAGTLVKVGYHWQQNSEL